MDGIFEWTIENFSWWNYEIHGTMILYSERYASSSKEVKFLELFPRGISGKEEHLVICFCNPRPEKELEISFIGSNGSLIKTESVHQQVTSFLYTGPKFENIVAQIRKNDMAFHKDKLTLRIRDKYTERKFAKRHVHTIIDVFDTSLKLNCENLKNFLEAGYWGLISEIQYTLDEGKKGQLDFYAFKTGSKYVSSIYFKLRSFSANVEKARAQICITYERSDESIEKFLETEHTFTRDESEWEISKPMPYKELLYNHTPFIHVNMKIVTGNIPKTYSCFSWYPDRTKAPLTDDKITCRNIPRPDITVDVLSSELMRVYQDHDFCDFQIRCGQFTFPVHKVILSARSPVFQGMLREGVSGSMDIEDLDGPTLSRFLAFLYSGKVEDLQWDSALKLYYAADKYQVPSLKKECVSVLSSNVSVSNVGEILSLAERHKEVELKSVAQRFIKEEEERRLEFLRMGGC